MSHSLRHAVDWRPRPTLIFESDDWGACEYAPSEALWREERRLYPEGEVPPYINAKLESPAEIDRLSAELAGFIDSTGTPAIFTAFVCLANPDFSQITAQGRYIDRFVSEGFPSPWQGAGVVESWQRAMRCGTFFPEFHTRLHHTHASDWMALLSEGGELGDAARRRFERGIYYQDRHYPEYRGMSREEIRDWVTPAVAAFERLFGFAPSAAITSDATSVVEAVWAECGMKTFGLRNFSIPGAEPIIYHTKPWNNQDATTPMGAWNPETDVIYLNRNIFFEPGFDPNYNFEQVLANLHAVWARNEPAVVSTHRLNYVNYNAGVVAHSFAELRRLLTAAASVPGIRFSTTREVAEIYRNGLC